MPTLSQYPNPSILCYPISPASRSREAKRAVSSVLKVTKPVEVQTKGSPEDDKMNKLSLGIWKSEDQEFLMFLSLAKGKS